MASRLAIGYDGPSSAAAAATLRASQLADADVMEDSKPRHECGVFGVFSQSKNASRVAFFALYALNHRALCAAERMEAVGQARQRCLSSTLSSPPTRPHRRPGERGHRLF